MIDNFRSKRGLNNYVKSTKIEGKTVFTKSGQVWFDMMKRCKRPHSQCYIGCSVTEEFKNFNLFVEWHQKQIGFDAFNYHIDKDILFPGNKVYAKDKCALVPSSLNMLFTGNKNINKALPQGVRCHSSGGFKSAIAIGGVNVELGLYRSVEEALTVYQNAKRNEILRWVKRLLIGEFIVDPKVINALIKALD